uniref:Major facilitator superfamily (MFS) profile domain-containing protein n=1 Tax=Timema genevievae TaxID=629358 RepID=A0A7R9K0V7_TIMGE|nr:unnamed protein product [Timema genevievae]
MSINGCLSRLECWVALESKPVPSLALGSLVSCLPPGGTSSLLVTLTRLKSEQFRVWCGCFSGQAPVPTSCTQAPVPTSCTQAPVQTSCTQAPVQDQPHSGPCTDQLHSGPRTDQPHLMIANVLQEDAANCPGRGTDNTMLEVQVKDPKENKPCWYRVMKGCEVALLTATRDTQVESTVLQLVSAKLFSKDGVLFQTSGIGEPSVYHALVVIFLEFFAWGLLTMPIIAVSTILIKQLTCVGTLHLVVIHRRLDRIVDWLNWTTWYSSIHLSVQHRSAVKHMKSLAPGPATQYVGGFTTSKTNQTQECFLLKLQMKQKVPGSVPDLPLSRVLNETFPDHTFLMNGLIMGIKGLLSFLSAPLIGALSDVWGRKFFLLITVFFTCAPIPLMTINTWWFFAMISISGVFAVTFSVVFAYVADVTEEHERSLAYGLVSATFAASMVISPALGAYMMDAYSENLVVALATAIAILDVFFILVAVPESLPEKVRPSSWGAPISWEQADPFAVSISQES